MQFFTITSLLAAAALVSAAPAAAADSGSYTTWNNLTCDETDGSHKAHTGIQDGVCGSLPELSFKVDYLRTGCSFQVFSNGACTGAPAASYQVSTTCQSGAGLFSYKVVC